jgi:alkanesulfonate monooxygenase SsuD/methylene tetrahydromethanopterin reductase-like flavin-dependent oxidoreductase (luciferase family)
LIAKQAITLQDISDGRLEFRTGAGANLQYANQWWHPYGIDYPENSKRVSIIEEGVELLKIIFEDSLSSSSMISSTINFDGNYFKINGVNFKKPLQKIPITIAAKKYKMIRIAANFADIWETSFMSPDQFLLSKKFFEKCLLSIKNNENIGINKDRNVLKSIELDVLIADTENELEYKKKILAMERGPQVYYQIIKNGLVGLPDTIAKKVKEYLNAGVDQFFLAFQDPFDLKSIELFMNSMRDFGLR